MTPAKRFILWDPRDGEPRRNDDGTYATGGILGRIGPENPYLTAYAAVLPGEPLPQDLEIGQFTVARYSLSGSSGVYQIHRVEDAP